MPDINWGGDAAGAPFKSRLDDASGNLILAETDTGTGLFEWDGSAWQFRGPVEMNGEDVSGIGSLTATSGNFDSVKTDRLNTNPTGAILSLDGDQTIDDGTVTDINWAMEDVRGEITSLFDGSDITIPSDVSWIKLNIGLKFDQITSLNLLRTRKNGSITSVGTFATGDDLADMETFPPFVSVWIPVSGNDTITTELRHDTGQSVVLRDTDETRMGVWLI